MVSEFDIGRNVKPILLNHELESYIKQEIQYLVEQENIKNKGVKINHESIY